MKDIATLVVALLFVLINEASAALPTTISGTWENIEKNERGTITIVITKEVGVRVEGIIHLTGSTKCVLPIPFRGTHSEKGVSVTTDTPGICGHDGVLTAEATVAGPGDGRDNRFYVGTFLYNELGGIWEKGTFRLESAEYSKK